MFPRYTPWKTNMTVETQTLFKMQMFRCHVDLLKDILLCKLFILCACVFIYESTYYRSILSYINICIYKYIYIYHVSVFCHSNATFPNLFLKPFVPSNTQPAPFVSFHALWNDLRTNSFDVPGPSSPKTNWDPTVVFSTSNLGQRNTANVKSS